MISSIILCGGRGRRMGREKGTLEYKGKPMLMHILEKICPIFKENILVLRDDEQKEDYNPLIHRFPDITVVTDILIDEGPLVGLYTALSVMKSDSGLVFPCDSPLIPLSSLKFLKDYDLNGYDALVPCWSNGKIEPLHSIYYKKNTVKSIEKILETDSRSMKTLLNELNVLYVAAELVDPTGEFFLNMNEPGDLERSV